MAVSAMVVADGVAERHVALDEAAGHVDGFVGGIVEHLDVEFLRGILQLADGFEQALDHVLLVEDRQLDGNARQIRKTGSGRRGAFFSMLVIEIHQHIPVHAVTGKQNQDDEIRNEQGHVKGVGVVESAKGGVEKMLADVGPDAFWGELREASGKDEISVQTRSPVRTSILPDSGSYAGRRRLIGRIVLNLRKEDSKLARWASLSYK